MIDVIYLAAGQGKRAGLGYPKQFARLGGKPIMVHGLEVLRGMKEIGKIIVTAPSGQLTETWEILASYIGHETPDVRGIEGGKTRQESVGNALRHVTSEHVLITEAVRPFITTEFVRKVINSSGDFITPVKPAVSTVILWGGCLADRTQARTIPRNYVGEVQMPQKYRTEFLRHVHDTAFLMGVKNATDDIDLVMRVMERRKENKTPNIITGLEENIKITTPLDLIIAEAIYNARYRTDE